MAIPSRYTIPKSPEKQGKKIWDNWQKVEEARKVGSAKLTRMNKLKARLGRQAAKIAVEGRGAAVEKKIDLRKVKLGIN